MSHNELVTHAQVYLKPVAVTKTRSNATIPLVE